MKLPKNQVFQTVVRHTLAFLFIITLGNKYSSLAQDTCPNGFFSRSHNWLAKSPTGNQTELQPSYHLCQPCNCNPLGSLSQVCNKSSGSCYCSVGYQGFRCTKCASGYVESPNRHNERLVSCVKCGECYKYWFNQLEELRSVGISLITQTSNVLKARVVTINLPDGGVANFLNSSRFEISEKNQEEPIHLEDSAEQLTETFLEAKRRSDQIASITLDIESFLTNHTNYTIGDDSSFPQLQPLISSLNFMEQILDLNMDALQFSKSSFDKLKMREEEFSAKNVIKSASNRSCELASVVSELKDNFLVEINNRERGSESVEDPSQYHRQEMVHDKYALDKEKVEELALQSIEMDQISEEIRYFLLSIEEGSAKVPQHFRDRMFNAFNDFRLIRARLQKNLEASRYLEEVFAENAQSLSKQHENLISLHKKTDEILQSLRYRQFRCDKFM